MLNCILPFAVGKSDASTALAASLGNLYEVDGKIYRLCKNGASDILTAAQKTLVTALSSGVPTWVVTTTTTANSWLAAGVVPVGQVGTGATSTTLVAGDYFLLQVSGACKVISAAAIADGGLIGTSTTAGKVDDLGVSAGVGTIGVALEAAAAADENTDVLLRGLI